MQHNLTCKRSGRDRGSNLLLKTVGMCTEYRVGLDALCLA